MMRNGSCSSLTSSDQNAATSAGTTAVLKKGPWTAAEDAILMDYVHKHGEGNWNAVQKNCGLARCGKSCRLRWANHLRPNLKKGSFTPEEEMLILQLHAQLGNKWARMAAQLPGRTDNEIKNFWNTRIKRRQRNGLPLYPNEIHQQQQRRIRPSPLNLPSATSPAAMPLLFSPEDQRMKGMWISTPTTGMSNMFQYNFNGNGGNYNETMNSSLMMPIYSAATVKTELPSNQLFSAGGGGGRENGCRLLDAMLEETLGNEDSMQRKMVMAEPIGAMNDFGGNGGSDGDDKDLFGESFPKFEDNGINVKRKREEEISSTSMQDDISKLFDMISTPGMPAAPQWSHTASDCCEISNGRQSSAATDYELGLELQNLASSLSVAPSEQDWNIGSCSWSNMPRIC